MKLINRLKGKQMNKDDIIETQFVQRAYDGHYEQLVRVLDHENAYTFKSESGILTTLTPEKWLTIAVYPFMMEFV